MEAKDVRELFLLFSEMTARPTDKYTHEVYDGIRMENKSHIDFYHWLKTHYPEALAEWNALNKIAES